MSGMTLRRLEWALRSRGPALDAWPEGEREAALALLRDDAAARRVLADALAGDEDAPETEADRVVLFRMQRVVRRALAPSPPVVRGIGYGAMAACLAAGLYLGAGVVESDAAGALGPATASNLPATVFAALDP